MSMTVGQLRAVLDLDDSQFERGLDRSEKRFGRTGSALAGMAKKAAIGTAAALGAGAIAGVNTFANLQRGMNEVFTLMPGISEQAMGKMTGQVKDFATEFGTLPSEVVPALYQSLSAGVPKGSVFDFLEEAQKAATAGVSDLKTAVSAISGTVNAYGSDVLDAGSASDLMFTAVKQGVTTFEELAGSLSNVTPIAAANGVAFSDLTAAVATMTKQGEGTAESTTKIRQALVELSDQGSEAGKAFEEVAGKSFREFIEEGGNLAGAMGVMEDAAKDNGVSVDQMFGSVEAGTAALMLSGAQAKNFQSNIDAMGDSAGATEQAYETMDRGIGRSFDRIKASGSVALANVGEALAPLVASMAGFAEDTLPVLAEQVGPAIADALATANMLIQTSIGLWNDYKVPILIVAGILAASYIPTLLAAAKTKVVTAAMQVKAWALERGAALKTIGVHVATVAKTVAGWALMGAKSLAHAARVAAAWLLSVAPIALVIAAVVGLVALIVKNWDTIKRVIAAGWNWVKRKTSQFVSAVVSYVRDLRDRAIAFISSVVDFVRRNHPIMILWRLAQEWVPKVIDKVRDLKDRVIGFFTGAKDWLFGAGKNIIQGLIDGAGSLLSKLGQFFLDKVPGWIRGPLEKALGISSPSKVAADIAKQIPRGMAVGMESEASALARAAERMAMQALPRIGVPQVHGSLHSGGASRAAGGGVIVENLELKAYTDRFDLGQVQDQLALRGAK